MLFLATSNLPVGLDVRVGANAVADFDLGLIDVGAIQWIASSPPPPFSQANFPLTITQLSGWGWGLLTFSLRVAPFSQQNPPPGVPVSLVVSQNGHALQALGGPQNNPINGAAPPFGPVDLGSVTPPAFQDFGFGIYFQ